MRKINRYQLFARELLILCGVRLLIFDELHNIISDNKSEQSNLLKIIKRALEQDSETIVFGGTQVAQRFCSSLRRSRTGSPTSSWSGIQPQPEFGTSSSPSRDCYSQETSKINEDDKLAEHIHRLSGGMIGGVHELLRKTALHVIETGEERITIKGHQCNTIWPELLRRMPTGRKK